MLGLEKFPSASGVLRVGFGDYPTDDSREEVVGHFPTVGEVNFFEIFGVVGHFEHGVGGYVPYGFHLPAMYILSALRGEGGESFICYVETVANVDDAGTFAHEGTDIVD